MELSVRKLTLLDWIGGEGGVGGNPPCRRGTERASGRRTVRNCSCTREDPNGLIFCLSVISESKQDVPLCDVLRQGGLQGRAQGSPLHAASRLSTFPLPLLPFHLVSVFFCTLHISYSHYSCTPPASPFSALPAPSSSPTSTRSTLYPRPPTHCSQTQP